MDFIRFLELSGIKTLLEDMTAAQAKGIFKQYGATDNDLSAVNLRKTWIRLVQQLHPDKTGGDSQPLAYLNAAYDVLKSMPVSTTPVNTHKPSSTDTAAVPAWQTDTRDGSRISREDLSDINYFKKMMWLISGKSHQKWTIYAFDGKFFRDQITVFGSTSIFSNMAHAMRVHAGRGTKAVFAQEGRDQGLSLIWLNGQPLTKPIYMDFESSNGNPSDDQYFLRSLPQTLDQIASGADVTG